jgi:hypothetical protein
MGRVAWIALTLWILAAPAARAQSGDGWPEGRGGQRPLATVDPLLAEPGWFMVEIGAAFAHDREIPAVGLRGNVLRVPELTLRLNVARRVELRVDTGYDVLFVHDQREAPLSDELDYDGEASSDIRDPVVSTLVRVHDESEGAPAIGLKIATRLPVASNQSGLGLDTTDFFVALLAAQDAVGLRWVANLGLGILEVPTAVTSQNDVLTYGFSFARAVTNAAELVGEFNGRLDVREGDPPPGTDSSSVFRVGARYTIGGWRGDAALLFGLTRNDPAVGFGAGFTYVFSAFSVP